jgi:chemotaxis protein histidine kinase CheA
MDNNILHYLSHIELKENETTSDVEVLRTGMLQDREWKIEMPMLKDYVKNFEDNVYGTEIQVNKEHLRGSEAMGWVNNLFIKGRKLIATVEWTELGTEAIQKKIFKFVSAELAVEYPHHKTGEKCKNVFIGMALTNTPALKNQTPLALSEELNNLFSKKNNMFEKFLSLLKDKKIVSKEEKILLKEYLEELPEEEKTPEVEKDVAEVEAKPEEEAKAEEKTEEEKKEEEKKAEELKEKAKKAETLEEKLNVSNKELAELREKIERKELSEEVGNTFVLSADHTTGIAQDKAESVVNFMLSLSTEQKNDFKEIMSAVKTVDLSEVGSTRTEKVDGVDLEEKIVLRAEELMSKDKTLDAREAQKQATKELTK